MPGRLRNLGPRALSVIGRQKWLDRPSYQLEHALSYAYNALGDARNSVTNALNGVWLGHPAHPPLASLTSGALGTTVALDALSLLPGRPTIEVLDASRFASRSLGLGILASVGSALTGVTDWQHTHEEDRRVGLVHGVVNLAATGLYTASWWDRRHGRHAAALRSPRWATASPWRAATSAGRWSSSPVSESTSREPACAPKSGRRCCPPAR